MKKETRSWSRDYYDLPKIPTFITRNYNRSPHYIKYKLWCLWRLDKKPWPHEVNPEFAHIFAPDDKGPTHIKDSKGRYKRNPARDVLLHTR